MPATPFDAATDVLNRARDLLALDGPGVPDARRQDVRRAALTMGVAAIDTYLHWAVRRVDLDDLSTRLGNVSVPFSELVAMGDASVDARKRRKRDRPRVRARNVLIDQLLTMTFQSPRQVETALAMVGVPRGLAKVARAFVPATTRTGLEARLGEIVHRRNKIVHEGGLKRQVRPQQVHREPLDRSTVDADLDWIALLLNALRAIAP